MKGVNDESMEPHISMVLSFEIMDGVAVFDRPEATNPARRDKLCSNEASTNFLSSTSFEQISWNRRRLGRVTGRKISEGKFQTA
jgi:hypothetical protein